MNRRHLRYFVEIASSGGFTAASRRLNVSQPALLYQMNELEALLGTKLFHRHPRGVDLTSAGRTFLPFADHLLQQYETMEAAVAPFREASVDAMHVGFAPTPAKVLAPELIAALASERPELRITLRQALSGALTKDVLKGDLDCAFCYEMIDTRGRFIPLFKEHFYLIGSADHVRTEDGAIPFRELGNFELILVSDYEITRNIIRNISEKMNVDLAISLESNMADISRSLVRFHGRTTIAPLGLYLDVAAEARLGFRRIVEPEIVLAGGLIFRPGFPRKTRDFLRMHFKRMVDQLIAAGDVGWLPV